MLASDWFDLHKSRVVFFLLLPVDQRFVNLV